MRGERFSGVGVSGAGGGGGRRGGRPVRVESLKPKTPLRPRKAICKTAFTHQLHPGD